jgi:hypothetical protein
MPLNSYENLARSLEQLAEAAGERECGASEVQGLAEAVRSALDLRFGAGNRYSARLAVMVEQSMALAHMGAVHGSILLQMAALMEVGCQQSSDET